MSERAITSLYITQPSYETPMGSYGIACPAVNHYYQGGHSEGLGYCRCCVSPTRKLEPNKMCVCVHVCVYPHLRDISYWIHEHVRYLYEWLHERMNVQRVVVCVCRAYSIYGYTCTHVISACVTLHHCGTICVWVMTDIVCLYGGINVAGLCTPWMPGRECGLLTVQGSIFRKPHNTNIYVRCIERKFFRNMIKDGLNGTGCYD